MFKFQVNSLSQLKNHGMISVPVVGTKSTGVTKKVVQEQKGEKLLDRLSNAVDKVSVVYKSVVSVTEELTCK